MTAPVLNSLPFSSATGWLPDRSPRAALVGRSSAGAIGGDDESTGPARFSAPSLPPHFIRRERLRRQLSRAARHRVILVTGSPGAGKSVLLADWVTDGLEMPGAWLTLDESDNSPSQFWRHIARALQSLTGADGQQGRLASETEPLSRHAGRSIAAGRCGHRLLLLDDVDLVNDRHITGSMGQLVRLLPPHVRLVLAVRDGSRLPMQDLVGDVDVATLSDVDLRFSADEAGALIALISQTLLGPDEVRAITTQAHGLAAGLCSAAVELRACHTAAQVIRPCPGGVGSFGLRLPRSVAPPPTQQAAMSILLSPLALAVPTPSVTKSFHQGDRVIMPLTPREAQVLAYLPSHLNQREIAALMYVSRNTVKTHLKNLYNKLGAKSRAEVVAIACGLGLLELTASPRLSPAS